MMLIMFSDNYSSIKDVKTAIKKSTQEHLDYPIINLFNRIFLILKYFALRSRHYIPVFKIQLCHIDNFCKLRVSVEYFCCEQLLSNQQSYSAVDHILELKSINTPRS